MTQVDLIPNVYVRLADGKETGFTTGLFHSLRHKELDGPVTYLTSSVAPLAASGEADNILVVRKHEAYKAGGTYANSTLFAFRKHGEFYKLFHKELSSPVTYDPETNSPRAEGVAYGDNLLVVRNRTHSAFLDYQLGGRWENSTLFSIAKEGGFYQLFHRELNAPVTYMPSSMAPPPREGNRDDILVVRNASHPEYASYQPGGRWVNSTLFTFHPERYRLSALISDFKYAEAQCSREPAIADTLAAMVWTVRNESLTDTEVHNVEVTKVVEDKTSWTFAAGDERTFFQEVDVNISARPCDGGNFVAWDNKSTPLDGTKTAVTGGSTIGVTLDVDVPPRHSTEYLLSWKRVETLVPFTARVIVTALADRLAQDGSVSEMVPVDVDGVMSLMVARGYKGFLRNDGKNVVASISGSALVSGVKRGEVTRRDVAFSPTI